MGFFNSAWGFQPLQSCWLKWSHQVVSTMLKTDYEKKYVRAVQQSSRIWTDTLQKKGGNKTSAEQGNAESLSDFARRNEQIRIWVHVTFWLQN